MAISENPPAFPNDARIQLGDDYQGMTLRDWFAGQALVGILADPARAKAKSPTLSREIAGHAFAFADAMLSARKGEQAS